MYKVSLRDIGEQGELLVASNFKRQGCDVRLSPHKYDEEKDLTIDGVMTEVKTETIYRRFEYSFGRKAPAFTICIDNGKGKVYSNQLNKCINVERLIFVARSSVDDMAVRVYEAPPVGKRNFIEHTNARDKRKVAGILISDLKEIAVYEQSDVVEYFMDNWRSM